MCVAIKLLVFGFPLNRGFFGYQLSFLLFLNRDRVLSPGRPIPVRNLSEYTTRVSCLPESQGVIHSNNHQRGKEAYYYQHRDVCFAGDVWCRPLGCATKTGLTGYKPVPSNQRREHDNESIKPSGGNEKSDLSLGDNIVCRWEVAFDSLVHYSTHNR